MEKLKFFSKKLLYKGILNLLLFITTIASTITLIIFLLSSLKLSQDSLIYSFNQSGSYQPTYTTFSMTFLILFCITISILIIIVMYMLALKSLNIKILKAKIQYKLAVINQTLFLILYALNYNILNNVNQLNNYTQCQQSTNTNSALCQTILKLNTPETSISNIGNHYQIFIFIIAGICIFILISNIFTLITFFKKMKGNIKHATV